MCCWLPVKYWSRAPKEPGSPIRRSICIPDSTTTLVFLGPWTSTSLTMGMETNAFPTDSGSGAVPTRSMSPMVSSQRLRLPAGNRGPMSGHWSRRAAITSSATGSAWPIGVRLPMD